MFMKPSFILGARFEGDFRDYERIRRNVTPFIASARRNKFEMMVSDPCINTSKSGTHRVLL
jgi:hypothetical protein